MNTHHDCVIIGAGIAGLVLGGRLERRGYNVLILDKGRGVGGRTAIRRFNGGVFDNGAQFFTAQSPSFRELVDDWLQAGVVRVWGTGFASSSGSINASENERYCGKNGMNDIAKYLALGLTVQTSARVRATTFTQGNWIVHTEHRTTHSAQTLVVTTPVPQAMALLQSGHSPLPESASRELATIHYAPCISVMAILADTSGLPKPGGICIDDGIVRWIGDNQMKGISPDIAAVTIHANTRFSADHVDEDPATIAPQLLAAAQPHLQSPVVSWQAHRWRYSHPTAHYKAPYFACEQPGPLILAGDGFGGPSIEGAATSALAALPTIESLLQR